MNTVHPGELPVDELPNGLPMFGIFLHLPAVDTQLQVFRALRSYVKGRVTVHTLLVHPNEMDAISALEGALCFFQLHGQIWVLRDDAARLTLGRIGRDTEYLIAPTADGGRVCLADPNGQVLAAEDTGAFVRDDHARIRILCAGFLAEYDDDTLSIPLVRAYPGRTSLIHRTRPFSRLFRHDPIGPGTDAHDPWAYLGRGAAFDRRE